MTLQTGRPIENPALVIDLLLSLSAGPRAYTEVMDAWRTSCPRLPIWEDALEHGFVLCQSSATGTVVALTDAGRAYVAGRS